MPTGIAHGVHSLDSRSPIGGPLQRTKKKSFSPNTASWPGRQQRWCHGAPRVSHWHVVRYWHTPSVDGVDGAAAGVDRGAWRRLCFQTTQLVGRQVGRQVGSVGGILEPTGHAGRLRRGALSLAVEGSDASDASDASGEAIHLPALFNTLFPSPADKRVLLLCLLTNVLSVMTYVVVAPCLGNVIDVISASPRSTYAELARAVGMLGLAYVMSNSTLAAQGSWQAVSGKGWRRACADGCSTG